MKYAIRNLIRIPQRTLIMFTVLFTVLLLLMWSALTSALCARAIDARLGALDGTVRITDGNARFPEGKVGMNIMRIRKYDEAFDIIEGYSAFYRTSCDAIGIDPIVASNKDENVLDYGAHMLYACSSTDIIDLFMNGSLEIVKGTSITKQNEAELKRKLLVSDILAMANSLDVGSVITLKISYHDGYTKQTIEEDFVVGGIFTVNEHFESGDLPSYKLVENNIYMPLSTYYAITGADNISPTEAYLHLSNNSTRAVSALEERMHDFGNTSAKLVRYTPESITAGISRLLLLVRITSILLTVCGLIAFLIMILLNLQSRTRELGVLTALGKPRGQTVYSFFFEVLLISLAALLAALLIFTATANVSGELIGSFLGSEQMNETHVNSTYGSLIRASESLPFSYDLAPVLIRSVLIALASAMATLAAAFAMIRMYLHKIDVIRVLGGGVG